MGMRMDAQNTVPRRSELGQQLGRGSASARKGSRVRRDAAFTQGHVHLTPAHHTIVVYWCTLTQECLFVFYSRRDVRSYSIYCTHTRVCST